MGYFTIKLPGNKKGDVRYGPIKKMKKLSHRFQRKNFEEEQPAYIVKVDAGLLSERIYYLVRTKDGEWVAPIQDELSAAIKNTIDKNESRWVCA